MYRQQINTKHSSQLEVVGRLENQAVCQCSANWETQIFVYRCILNTYHLHCYTYHIH